MTKTREDKDEHRTLQRETLHSINTETTRTRETPNVMAVADIQNSSHKLCCQHVVTFHSFLLEWTKEGSFLGPGFPYRKALLGMDTVQKLVEILAVHATEDT